MLFELRTYDLKPGKAPVYLEFFRTAGVALVTRHLPMMGYWMVESGRLNRIEHLWAYRDMAERDACRAGLAEQDDAALWRWRVAARRDPALRPQAGAASSAPESAP